MNIIKKIFKELDNQNIKYSTDYKERKETKFFLSNGINELGYIEPAKYPKNLIKNFVLKVNKYHLIKVVKIIKGLGFKFYRFSKGLTYFYFDMNFGLLRLDLIVSKVSKISFKKPEGKFVCFVGPEGGGKTSTLSAVYTILENFPVERKLMNFSSFKKSKIWRIYDLINKIFLIKFNKERLILSDRYLYLTFRKNLFFKKIIRFIAPEPDIVFIMKADYKTLKKRRGPICSDKKNVENMYGLFEEAKNKIIINTNKSLNENIKLIIDKILTLYMGNEDEKLIRKFI